LKELFEEDYTMRKKKNNDVIILVGSLCQIWQNRVRERRRREGREKRKRG